MATPEIASIYLGARARIDDLGRRPVPDSAVVFGPSPAGIEE